MTKKNFWLMAAMVLSLSLSFTACSDDDDDNNGSEQKKDDVSPLDTDEARVAWRWLCALTNAEGFDTNWKSKTWEPTVGQASENSQYTRIVVVDDLDGDAAALLRLGHDKCCLYQRNRDAALCQHAYNGKDLGEVVEKMARSHKKELKTEELVIPSPIIRHMIESCGSELDPSEGCRRYLEAYLEES